MTGFGPAAILWRSKRAPHTHAETLCSMAGGIFTLPKKIPPNVLGCYGSSGISTECCRPSTIQRPKRISRRRSVDEPALHCDCVLRQVGAHNGILPELIGD